VLLLFGRNIKARTGEIKGLYQQTQNDDNFLTINKAKTRIPSCLWCDTSAQPSLNPRDLQETTKCHTVRVHKGRVENGHQENRENAAQISSQIGIDRHGTVGGDGSLNGSCNYGTVRATVGHWRLLSQQQEPALFVKECCFAVLSSTRGTCCFCRTPQKCCKSTNPFP